MKDIDHTTDKQTNNQAEPKKLFMVNAGLNQFIIHVRKNLGLFLSISFGVFLFVLFFQPFNLDYFEFNNRLIFVAGMATILQLRITRLSGIIFNVDYHFCSTGFLPSLCWPN